VIAAGGTAGHVVPALAVADALRAEGAEVAFIGGARAEARARARGGLPAAQIAVEGLSRSNPLRRCARSCSPRARSRARGRC
jgi:UDP-N-acetylglucosamine--N-acetylmuramyl-(pentapeptide) pyrophosphoryl-undecaprenol N-acetylglucosamine transferase